MRLGRQSREKPHPPHKKGNTAMGFKANGSVQLVLPKSLDGLVVEVVSRTTGEFLSNQAVDLDWEDDSKLEQAERTQRYRELYGQFLADVVSWNLEAPDGSAVPVDLAGLQTVDQPITTAMVGAWAFRNVKLPDPLDDGSPAGSRLERLSIPMEPGIPNPAS